MFKFALKNMAIKKVKIVLIVISIVISSCVGILAYNIAQQVDSGFKTTAGYYDMIIGPSGSSTQLAMNTMFFTEKPLGTISYEYVEQLQKDTRVNLVVPFTMGDSYNAAKIVGTTPDFLTGKELSEGVMFSETFQCVLGSAVAEKYSLSLGDTLVTSHGLTEGGHQHESSPLTVVGILEKTKTAYDNVIFTPVETVWETHNHSDENHEQAEDTETTAASEAIDSDNVILSEDVHGGAKASDTTEADTHSDSHEAEENHEDESTHTHEDDEDTHSGECDEDCEEHNHAHEVCAILVKSKSFNNYTLLTNEFSENSELLVINPSEVLREILDNVDMSTTIVYILCLIILVMNIFIISVITLLNMYDSKKEIALMRLIGIGMNKINLMYIIQNAIIGLISVILAFISSRICLMLMGSFVASMGIVLDTAVIYPFETVIMAVVFIISVLPTVICTVNMSKKDGISE